MSRRSGSTRAWVPVATRVGLALVIGLGATVVTRAIRDGGETAGADVATSPNLAFVTEAELIETGVPVVSPIASGDDPSIVDALPDLGDPATSVETIGIDYQTDVVDILSPMVGTAQVPTGTSTEDGEGPTPAPAALGLALGGIGIDLEASYDDTIDVEPVPVDVDLSALPEMLIEFAATREPIPFEGGPSEGGTATGPATDGVGFDDPCADSDSEACPDPGEPGTVTQLFALTAPPPFNVTIVPNHASLCRQEVGDGELRVAITSTTPLESFGMNYWKSGWPSPDLWLTIATPADVADAWMDEFIASEADPPPPIVHCATLTELENGVRHQYRASATDVFDRLWEPWGTPPYFDGPEWERPATLVLRLTDNELMVSAAHRDNQSVRIWAFRRNDEPIDAPIDPCAGTADRAPGHDQATRPIEPVVSTISSTRLRDAGFDPAYFKRTAGALRLKEGSAYRLCVYRSVMTPSFAAGVDSVEAFDITTPDALDFTFSVQSVTTTDDALLPASSLRVGVRPVGRGVMLPHPWCGDWYNDRDIRGRDVVMGHICSAPGEATDLYERGAVVTAVTTDLDGDKHELSWVIRLPICGTSCVVPPDDLYRLELPTGAPRRDFWCGGFGDACDRPSGESYGTFVIRVGYGNERSSGRSAWTLSGSTELGDLRSDPPPTPRLDTYQVPSSSGPATDKTVVVPILADRPVTATVSIFDETGALPCIAPGSPTTITSTGLSANFEVAFEGLCPSQEIFPVVQLTDAGGNTSLWHGWGGINPSFPPAERWALGSTRTAAIRWSATGSIAIQVPIPAERFRHVQVRVGSSELTFSPIIESPRGTTGCQMHRGEPVVANSSFRFHSDLEVTIEVTVEVDLLEVGCTRPGTTGFTQPDPIVLRTTVPFEAIVLGVPIVLVGIVPVAGLPDPAAVISVTATIIMSEHT